MDDPENIESVDGGEANVQAPPITHRDLALAYEAVINRAIVAAAGDPQRMQALLRPMPRFAQAQRVTAFAALAEEWRRDAEREDVEARQRRLRG